MKNKKSIKIISILIAIITIIYFMYEDDIKRYLYSYGLMDDNTSVKQSVLYSKDISEIPEYNGVDKYVVINNNEPNFVDDDLVGYSYEFYSDLDDLGRCGVAMANIGVDLMPTEARGEIGSVKPSGWQTVKYDFISGKYLYNRCHLIGYQLTGENANQKNLITCTRDTNIGVMLDYENKVTKYIKETNNHVLYRVTPIFEGNNLLASGIEMEGKSVEDNGEGIKYHIYIYNVQDGVKINYENGESKQK